MSNEQEAVGDSVVPPNTGFRDIDRFLYDTFEVMRKKGHDYRQGNDADLLHNFRTVANSVGTPMEKVWFTYFYKHYSALVTFIKEGGQQESEPIEARITDLIVYLVLFWKMVQEIRAQRGQDVSKGLEERLPDDTAFAPLVLEERLHKEVRAGLGTHTVRVDEGLVVDPMRLRKIAGIPGALIPESVENGNAARVVKELERRRDPRLGVSDPDTEPVY